MSAMHQWPVEYESVPLHRAIPSPDALACIPESTARRLNIIALARITENDKHVLLVASGDPACVTLKERLSRHLEPGVFPRFLHADQYSIRSALDRFYRAVVTDQELLANVSHTANAEQFCADNPDCLIQLLDILLLRAYRRGASDIHLTPDTDFLGVRFRIDGVLERVAQLHVSLVAGLLVRVKVLASLDIAESRLPQDGQFTQWIEGFDIDFRVSTFPTICGENLVLRALSRSSICRSLASFELPSEMTRTLVRSVHSPDGLVVICGPTGSGKSTTLHALLDELDSDTLNIMTLEDPVELTRKGIRQTTIDPQRNMGYPEALRALLRQDPDVLLIGEIRDNQSCGMAIRAALTGHRVLTTLHASDVFAVIERLLELGAEPAILGSKLAVVASQRLLRRICDVCGGNSPGLDMPAGPACRQCRGSGYHRRQVVMEVLEITPSIASMIAQRASSKKIRFHALEQGHASLHDSAQILLDKGLTTVSEVERVLGRRSDCMDASKRRVSERTSSL